MGREIRRVVPNWEHPRERDGSYRPLFNQDFPSAAKKWKEGLAAWEAGGRAEKAHIWGDDYQWWEYSGNPPDREYCHPVWCEEDQTWWQVYETISEGTPVTPPFATQEELVEYLVANGDFWDQSRGDGGWSRENAEAFVSRGWAPSLMIKRTAESVDVRAPRDGMPS
jgi:hypothetical protein